MELLLISGKIDSSISLPNSSCEEKEDSRTKEIRSFARDEFSYQLQSPYPPYIAVSFNDNARFRDCFNPTPPLRTSDSSIHLSSNSSDSDRHFKPMTKPSTKSDVAAMFPIHSRQSSTRWSG
jgi:hypothetical protein